MRRWKRCRLPGPVERRVSGRHIDWTVMDGIMVASEIDLLRDEMTVVARGSGAERVTVWTRMDVVRLPDGVSPQYIAMLELHNLLCLYHERLPRGRWFHRYGRHTRRVALYHAAFAVQRATEKRLYV